VAEGARLESVFRGNSNVGSNPTLSASPFLSITWSPDYPLTTHFTVLLSWCGINQKNGYGPPHSMRALWEGRHLGQFLPEQKEWIRCDLALCGRHSGRAVYKSSMQERYEGDRDGLHRGGGRNSTVADVSFGDSSACFVNRRSRFPNWSDSWPRVATRMENLSALHVG
jgi:hypothetical protein